MSRWFRFYADAIRNPKVAKLSDSDYRLWTELLAVAAENEGSIPCLEDLKSVLKRRLDHLSRGLDRLIRAGLIDPLEASYEPHNWSKFQYKSDTSTPRVTLHRSKRETPPETDTDTDTDNPPNPLKKGEAEYAFFGKVVRLVPNDLERWRKTYHGIADIHAELASIDAWLASPTTADAKRKAWFHTVAGALNRKHQEALREHKRGDGSAVKVGI